MRGEYDEIGFPAPPPMVYTGSYRFRAAPKGPAEWEKYCSACDGWYPLDSFWRAGERKDGVGRRVRCISCERDGEPA